LSSDKVKIIEGIPKEEKELLEKEKPFVMPNLQEEAQMFEWAGVSFGEEESFKIQKAIKKLAIMSGASKLRLWGKIYGKQRDYLICESVMPPNKDKPSDPTVELRGIGTNEYVYWVTDSVLLDWIQLPEVSPEQIKIAKLIKHVFSGDLFSEVDTNPTFPGKERHYLRA
jgi:radial spoke head protein 4A